MIKKALFAAGLCLAAHSATAGSVDGQIYALAQGNVVIGGAGAAANGSKVVINQLSSGRVPAGATIERSVPNPALQGKGKNVANTSPFIAGASTTSA